MGQLEQNLVFLGLAGMMDPPREAAAGAVEAFRKASVRTVMITGDHADTALAIARQLGIAQTAGRMHDRGRSWKRWMRELWRNESVLYQSLHGCRRNIKSGLCGL